MKTIQYILMALFLSLCAQTVDAQSDRQFVRNGNKFYREQNYAKAEVEYRKALGKNASNTQAMYNLGCALLQQQKDSAAITQFETAGKTEKAHLRKAMAYHNIGVICQKRQLYAEAIEAYKESLRHNPNDNATRYNLALCKRLAKKQPLKNNNNNKNDKNKKDKDKKQQQQNKQNPNKNERNEQRQQNKEQMSKDNAEQLLNYAIQEEKATQRRLKQQQQQPQRRRLQKNW
ncbi:tetratricopeptide repeat protein [Hallella colorans]|uniref:Tetratricopeptide repeat protein n=1 Tax=Hallella colorans TaxID=1703337 RepID=A0A2U0U1I3_9BACT|nr:tetratricopeptide repeat protein [Hallella colorans]PVX50133.1 tetratricopeptide repeat protein [Hallella colorans]